MAKKSTKVTKAPVPAKEIKPLTPAKKPAKVVRKKTPSAPAAAPVVEAKPAKSPVSVAPAVPMAPAKALVTTITASFDVGFGNTLYLRGDGPGLSWEQGIALDNAASDQWSISFGEATGPITFKFLINDEVWSGGEDFVVAPGASVVLTPIFPGW